MVIKVTATKVTTRTRLNFMSPTETTSAPTSPPMLNASPRETMSMMFSNIINRPKVAKICMLDSLCSGWITKRWIAMHSKPTAGAGAYTHLTLPTNQEV